MKIVAVTQARLGSKRLPKKVIKKINGETLLEIHIKRILKSSIIDSVIIATTNEKEDDVIQKEAIRLNVGCFRGSKNDVLDRYYNSVKEICPDYIVRITSDCPLIDSRLVDQIIEETIKSKVDYCSNTLTESYPDGQDIEVFTYKALKKAWKESKLNSEREHVTPYIKKNSSIFKLKSISLSDMNYSSVRITVDELEDFNVIKMLIDNLGTDDTWESYANLYMKNTTINEHNIHIIRNEGYLMSLKNDENK